MKGLRFIKATKIFILFSVSLLGCSENKTDQQAPPTISYEPTTRVKSDSINAIDRTKYNLHLLPDTLVSFPPIYELKTSGFITAKGVVSKSGALVVLLSDSPYKRLWPANLPDLFKPNDTIIVSGYVYDIPGSERMPGYPMLIKSIYMNTTYLNKFP